MTTTQNSTKLCPASTTSSQAADIWDPLPAAARFTEACRNAEEIQWFSSVHLGGSVEVLPDRHRVELGLMSSNGMIQRASRNHAGQIARMGTLADCLHLAELCKPDRLRGCQQESCNGRGPPERISVQAQLAVYPDTLKTFLKLSIAPTMFISATLTVESMQKECTHAAHPTKGVRLQA